MTRPIRGLAVSWAATLLVAGLGLAGCGDLTTSPAAGTFTPRHRGVLTVVTTDIPSEGFWEGTPQDVTGGFEYELAHAMAKRFGLKSIQVKLEPFSQIVHGHLAGADMALDLITPTPERGRWLNFSSAYLNAAPTVLVRSDTDVPDLESAQALRWGAVAGTTFVGIIKNLIGPNPPLKTFANNAQMIASLKNGGIDAVLQDLPLAVARADRSHGQLAAVAQLPDAEEIAAALPKGSSNAQAVDSAIRAFTADGTIDNLLRRWVGPAAADAEQSIPLLRTTR